MWAKVRVTPHFVKRRKKALLRFLLTPAFMPGWSVKLEMGFSPKNEKPGLKSAI